MEEPLDDVMVFKERSNALIVVHYYFLHSAKFVCIVDMRRMLCFLCFILVLSSFSD